MENCSSILQSKRTHTYHDLFFATRTGFVMRSYGSAESIIFSFFNHFPRPEQKTMRKKSLTSTAKKNIWYSMLNAYRQNIKIHLIFKLTNFSGYSARRNHRQCDASPPHIRIFFLRDCVRVRFQWIYGTVASERQLQRKVHTSRCCL